MTKWKIGIIGGSGLYALDALENAASSCRVMAEDTG
jgi:purine nucleoside phosphorylase